MKRVVFAATLLVFLLGFNTFCLFTIGKVKNEATGRLETLYENLENGSDEKNAQECEKFAEYWISKQRVLCLIARHDLLNQITTSVSRFVPLAKYGEKGELSAEILHSKILIEEIWDSERPFLRNIF